VVGRFAPVLRFPEGEAFRPISIEQFLAQASLSRFYVRGRFSPQATIGVERERADAGPLPREALSKCEGFAFCYYALDLRIAEPRAGTEPYTTLQVSLGEARPVVYWNAVGDPSGDLALQYWLLYFYNGHKVNRHEGDWEQVTLHLDDNLVPVKLGYSSHHSGEREDWVDLVEGLNRVGDHPVVYVALGSHANYFAPGLGLGRECFLGICKNGIDDVPTRLDELRPDDYELVPLTGTTFAGNFGSGNFLWEGRFGWELDRLVVSDPRLRPSFVQPLAFFNKAREAP
jgi:Vacuolar protein sorting-associated protein 62